MTENRAAGAIESPEAAAAAWSFVHDLFRAPDERQWKWLVSKEVVEARRSLREALGLATGPDAGVPDSAAQYETEFIAAFDAGAPTPMIPLLESHYNKREPVPRILHENILFYSAFGLKLRDSAAETADHLKYQLEFVSYLYRLESGPTAVGVGCSQIRTARREYVGRHLLSWLPAACAKAVESPFEWAVDYLEIAMALAERETSPASGDHLARTTLRRETSPPA